VGNSREPDWWLKTTTIRARPDPLTPHQCKVFDFLYESLRSQRRVPSRREMAEHFEISKPAVTYVLGQLDRKGWINRNPNSRRAVTILFTPDGRPFTGFDEL
jgi:DNA-binding MarR family transcriptional regulator